MLIDPGSSAYGGIGASFMQLLDHFLFDVPSGSSHSLNLGMNEMYSASSTTTAYSGTYATMYSIMGISEGVTTPDSIMVLVLEIEMTIIYEKSHRILLLHTQ